MNEEQKCDLCEEPLDEGGDICSIGYRVTSCYPCYEDVMSDASRAWVVSNNQVTELYVTDYGTLDQHNDPYYELDITRKHTSVSEWRGYETSYVENEGYVEISHEVLLWGEDNNRARIIEELLKEPEEVFTQEPIVVTFDPTSNVFAQHVHLYAHEVDKDRVKELIKG